MKEKIIDFLCDFWMATVLVFKIVFLATLSVAPIFLACIISPWWLIGMLFTLPLAVTIIARM